MITEKILSLVFGVFDFIFQALPIPPVPDFYEEIILPFFQTNIPQGLRYISWIIPAPIWNVFWNTIYTLILVNLMYSLYSKFHKFVKRGI